MMLDIDGFKQINDRYGHSEGDKILKKVSREIEKQAEGTVGRSNYLGRWGGEEFLYIFPSKNIKATKRIGEKIRKTMEQWYRSKKPIINMPVTVSIGITLLRENDNCLSIINRSDKAMYTAKHKGGNKVEML